MSNRIIGANPTKINTSQTRSINTSQLPGTGIDSINKSQSESSNIEKESVQNKPRKVRDSLKNASDSINKTAKDISQFTNKVGGTYSSAKNELNELQEKGIGGYAANKAKSYAANKVKDKTSKFVKKGVKKALDLATSGLSAIPGISWIAEKLIGSKFAVALAIALVCCVCYMCFMVLYIANEVQTLATDPAASAGLGWDAFNNGSCRSAAGFGNPLGLNPADDPEGSRAQCAQFLICRRIEERTGLSRDCWGTGEPTNQPI